MSSYDYDYLLLGGGSGGVSSAKRYVFFKKFMENKLQPPLLYRFLLTTNDA